MTQPESIQDNPPVHVREHLNEGESVQEVTQKTIGDDSIVFVLASSEQPEGLNKLISFRPAQPEYHKAASDFEIREVGIQRLDDIGPNEWAEYR